MAPIRRGGRLAPSYDHGGMADSTSSPKRVLEHGHGALADTVDASAAGPENAGAVIAPVPHRIGRFVILRLLGQGGMGAVYSAYDDQLDRKVAVKILHHSEFAPIDRRARVLREAQAMARVSHPNVVQVYEVGEAEGQVFIAMEFIEGSALSAWQSERSRSWEDVLRVYRAAGQGLLGAHRVGLVHRDFKPDNVLVDKEGRPRVADFGLAHGEGSSEPSPSQEPSSPGRLLSRPLTMAGAIVGTPAYMSPEQCRGERGDARSDQFSFCAALYEALYKTLPFEGEDLAELSGNILLGKLRPIPAGTQFPAVIEQALRRGLSVDPAQRFPSMAELLSVLDIDPQRDPAGAPRSRRAFIAMMLSIVGLRTLYFALFQSGSPVLIRDMLSSAMLLCAAVLSAAWVLRRTLRQNAFQRELIILLIIGSFQLIAMRVIGLIAGLSVPQVVAMDLVSMSAFCTVIAWKYLPSFWVGVPYCLAGVLVAVFQPGRVGWFVAVGYPMLAVLMFAAWNRDASRSSSRAGSTVKRAAEK